MSGVDVAVLRRLHEDIGRDEAVMRELIHAFLTQSVDLLREGREAAARSDLRTFRRVVHTLKSGAATFGASSLSAMARRLEDHASEGGMGTPEQVAELEREFERVREELGAWKPGD